MVMYNWGRYFRNVFYCGRCKLTVKFGVKCPRCGRVL